MRLLLFFLLVSASRLLAQHRSVHIKLNDIETDTIKKQIIFHYRLNNIAPKDTLSIAIKRASGQLIKLKEVYGDVGIALTDGRKKAIFWNPVAERQKFDEDIEVIFSVKKVEHQGLTRKQTIDLVRWTISAGLIGYSALEALAINGKTHDYNTRIPTTAPEKIELNNEMNALQHREQQFYKIGAISAAALLANIAWSLMQAKTKLKPARFTIINSAVGAGIAYKL